ncbi:MAG: hypothetical protein RMJ84_13445, partial [Sandaracinaceae bacterium]|nr:hypothetical protein [Sandaracinaceae bacterium]
MAGDVKEPIFEGKAGRTRQEKLHFRDAAGLPRMITVTRVVNLLTDPHLEAPLLMGTLHRLEGAEGLAIPLVVHDPERRRVAIVLPEALRYLEIHERIRWLSQLVQEEGFVPRYVQEPKVVVGLAELQRWFEEPPESRVQEKEEELRRLEQSLHRKEQQLAIREQRLRERAEEVTRREDDVRERIDTAQALARELLARESELQKRLKALEEREQA